MRNIYQPSRTLPARIKRRLVPFQAKNLHKVALERPLVSFTFDDCPRSAIENGLPQLDAMNWQATVYVACGLFDRTNHLGLHMGREDTLAVYRVGHEIGDHTFSHFDASARPLSDALADIRKNQAEIVKLGLPESQSFAYPYGQTTPALKKTLQNYFMGARGITPTTHTKSVDMNQIGSWPLFAGAEFDTLMTAVNALKDNPGWMTIFTHDVRDNPSLWGCTPAQLAQIIQAVQDIGADVMPVNKAIEKLEMMSS